MRYIDWLYNHAATRPAKLAIVSPGVVLTYEHFYRAVLHTAERLAEARIEAGQTIALGVKHPALFCVLAMALDYLDCVIIGCNLLPGPTETLAVPEGIRIDRAILDQPAAAVSGLDSVIVSPEWLKYDAAMMRARRQPDHGSPDPDALAHIFTSSGTTGHLKAVGYSRRHMMALFSRRSFGILGEARDSIFCTFGLQGGAGFIAVFWTFWAGGTAFLGWAPEVTWQIISQNRIARIEGSPAQYRDMLRSSDPSMFDLSSLRLAVTGGSAMPPKLIYDIRSKVCSALLNIYGSTEVGIMSLGLALPGDPDGSSGRLMPWVKADAVDENGDVLPAGREGVLRFSCEDMPRAYMNDPRANEIHFRGEWFYSGDMGTISGERIVTLSGRSSELLNAGGVKVSPFAIESDVASFPGISECAVFGVADEFGLESIHAAVVADGSVDIPALRAYCAARLGPKAPTSFLQLPALPRNAAGKVSRADLAKIASARTRKVIGH